MSQQRANGSGFASPGPEFPDLPEATIARLPEYLRALHQLAEHDQDTVSSEGLATAAGVNSAKLRKDLSHLGSYGTRGVGYDVQLLIEQIEQVLGLHESRAVGWSASATWATRWPGTPASPAAGSTSPPCSTPIRPGWVNGSAGSPYGTSPRWRPSSTRNASRSG